MKKNLTLIIALLSFTPLWAQDWKIVIYADDKPAVEYKTNEIDSIVFEEYIPVTINADDGWYIYGLGTSVESISPLGMLKPAIEETTNSLREGLMETYIAIEAGGRFNIAMVKDKVLTNYGPSYSFNPETPFYTQFDEPQNTLLKGHLAESEATFKISDAGCYHIIYDQQLNTYAIAEVEWGIVGSAINNKWTSSTALPASFDKEQMTFTVDNLALHSGDFKFRYSNGWKIYLYHNDDWTNRITVNTNLGGSIDQLQPGGQNISNTDPGIYSISLTWTLGQGFIANMERTADLPVNNWENTQWDMVGNGVSELNVEASPDTLWQWGNSLLAENDGFPLHEETVYGYVWNEVKLNANSGFKLRNLTNQTSLNTEAGYAELYHDFSSTSVYGDIESNNLMVSKEGKYDVTLVIFTEYVDSILVYIRESEIDIEEPVDDNWYIIKENAEEKKAFDSRTRLKSIYSEFSSSETPDLLEIYMAIDAGEMFVLTYNSEDPSYYGPRDDFRMVSPNELLEGEPTCLLYKGGILETTEDLEEDTANIKDYVFTAPEAGLYHVVLDPKTMQCAIAKADWGIIGSATPNGWNSSIPMEINYSRNAVVFSIDSINLTNNAELKFRYGDGWRIYLGYDNEDPNVLAAFTNFGGTMAQLISGGDNIYIGETNTYQVKLIWTLDEGFTADFTSIENIQNTNWSTITWDMVGTGISEGNTMAQEDSIWNWGYRLMGDNGGLPTTEGEVYTYTWTDVDLLANTGFKLRNLMPELTSPYEIGYSQLDLYNSTSYAFGDSSTNTLSVSMEGKYDLSLQFFGKNNVRFIIQESATIEPSNENWYIWVQGSTHNMMNYEIQLQPIYNLATLTPFPNLLETFMAIDSGGSFFLMRYQDILTRYGPGSDFGMVDLESRLSNEPTGILYKGSLQLDADVFTVPQKGLYHIVINTSTGQCALAKADWGLVGSATPNGWDKSIPMTMDFALDSVLFTVDSVNLTSDAEIKFRYNDGWNLYLPNPDGQYDSIGAYTNLGSKYLVPGGSNIPILESNTYSVTLQWKIGEPFSYQFTPLASQVHTDWSNIRWDATGTGISGSNVAATMDSLWWWGNSIWADNSGYPMSYDSLFIYTWSHVQLLGDEGLKLRELNANHTVEKDIGYHSINHVLSSEVIGGNLENDNIIPAADGTFNISLTIDAYNNDAMSIVFTEIVDGEDSITTPTYKDGWYILKNATPMSSHSPLKLMTPAINEQNQTMIDYNLIEAYISISDTGAFSLIHLQDGISTTFGPGLDFTFVAEGTNPTDEPQKAFYKGSVTTSSTRFTVTEEGLYHIVYHTTTEQLVVAKAEWGIIGSATELGWTSDTKMSSHFEDDYITFEVKDIPLQGGEYIKFRYSEAWRITLAENTSDTLNNGVSVFTNLGGSLENLTPGGDNMLIENSGLYDVNLIWTITDGFMANLSKKEDLDMNDWSSTKWDIVGTGISNENSNTEMDTLWGWGNHLWSDNNGWPIEDNGVYTYTWTDISIHKDEGFKIRRLNADGTYFSDIGFSGLSNSASELYSSESDNNIKSSISGFFTITVNIDANNEDSMTATITQVSK